MEYTENNIIGLRVKVRNSDSDYTVTEFKGKWGTTISNHESHKNEINNAWFSLEQCNRWIKEGTWIVVSSPISILEQIEIY